MGVIRMGTESIQNNLTDDKKTCLRLAVNIFVVVVQCKRALKTKRIGTKY